MLNLNLVGGGSTLIDYGNYSLLNFTDIGILIMVSVLLIYAYYKLKKNQKNWNWEEDTLEDNQFPNYLNKDVLMQLKNKPLSLDDSSPILFTIRGIWLSISHVFSLTLLLLLAFIALAFIANLLLDFTSILYYSFN